MRERDGVIPARLSEFLRWPAGEPRPQRLDQYIALQYQSVAAIALSPLIGRIAAALAGTPEIRIFNSALIAKYPGADATYAVVGWHCDKAYWPTCRGKHRPVVL